MQSLRKQVDRIDQRLLQLLQQRTKLSGEIGRTKRRHGAEIYVPDRERLLLARVTKLAQGKLPAPAARAIFREIMSSSRAAQGQQPIGVIAGNKLHYKGTHGHLRWRGQNQVTPILRAARCQFGACDQFTLVRDWRELSRQLRAGKLAIGLLTFEDLVVALRDPYSGGLAVIGDFLPVDGEPGLSHRIFIVKPAPDVQEGTRALILIECKPTANAVKSRITSMPRAPKLIELTPLPGGGRAASTLAALTFRQPMSPDSLAVPGKPLGLVLGIYTTDDSHGG
jgi:chorismate mutase